MDLGFVVPTLLVTHRYQSEVPVQRLNTRVNLGLRGDGFVEDVDEYWTPKDERFVGDDDGFDSPFGREVSPAEQLRRSPRLLLPRFRLETVALRLESFLMIFSRSKPSI